MKVVYYHRILYILHYIQNIPFKTIAKFTIYISFTIVQMDIVPALYNVVDQKQDNVVVLLILKIYEFIYSCFEFLTEKMWFSQDYE